MTKQKKKFWEKGNLNLSQAVSSIMSSQWFFSNITVILLLELECIKENLKQMHVNTKPSKFQNRKEIKYKGFKMMECLSTRQL